MLNERIRELEKQATEIVRCGLNGTSTAESFNRKKFAELIVQECLDAVTEIAGKYDSRGLYNPHQIAVMAHRAIKNKFYE